ncbi:MFS transporter [Pelomonas sp. V22]|uniref:MFS transporter n=1 Tax=Pelomonas sp. V22 TaxID=2822139 RepID=UPI0024A84207|nr:MFS transporter [Pelomonas sp. V22]MDI4632921.1 MFS transporter [Pelomonas sp. V22]
MNRSARAARHPLCWVPSLYLAMGLPNVMVGAVAAILYKNLGIANEDIALYTSQMYLPWVLKPLWAPLLEPLRGQRWWILRMQFLMMASLGAVAFCLPLEGFFQASLAFFWITGFASATQDIVADGLFMATMAPRDQARYAGLQGMCWNLGAVLASGLLVSATGLLHTRFALPWVQCWMLVMAAAALLMGGFGLWHLRMLPTGAPASPAAQAGGLQGLRETWVSFFSKPQMAMMLAVVFFYRFGEGFIEKFGPLFLLDPRSAGGLGLDNATLGHINGTVGTLAFIAGALLGGLVAARLTLPRAFLLLALTLNLPHVTYFWLSQAMPESPWMIAALVTVEKFGFGMGSVGHMLYMMQQLAPGPFCTAHYAMATGVMALTKWSTGSLSGWVWTALGQDYRRFFLLVLLCSVPPVLLAWRAPFPHRHDRQEQPPQTEG